MKIALSILTVDYANVEKNISPILKDTDYIHMDVMDGVFVPNISFGYAFIASLRKITDLPFDTHLMIKYPQNFVKQFAESGSQYITFHEEADCDIAETIKLIHSYNVKAGLAIKPKTEVETIKPYLKDLEMVLVMSVEPGFGGQKFMVSAIEKVKELAKLRQENNYHYLINIDGGINNQTALLVKDYVDMAVCGSFVLNAKDPETNLHLIKNI